MATVGGGGMRLRRRRLPLADLTNLSSSTSRLKATAQSSSSIGSSTAPRARCPPPPLPPVVAGVKGKDGPTRELQSYCCRLKEIKKISKPNVKAGDMLPGTSSPPSKKTRKSSGDPLASQNFIEEQRTYFAEVDAFELVEEFASSESDLE